nr:MAG TPA: hypothetical protein [Caudoviricetes sp.]
MLTNTISVTHLLLGTVPTELDQIFSHSLTTFTNLTCIYYIPF